MARRANMHLAAALVGVMAADIPGGSPSLMPGLPSSPELLKQRDVERALRAAAAIPKAEAKRERKKAKRRALISVQRNGDSNG